MYNNIADMDTQVGQILKQLEDDGLSESTIVLYWSDHGDGVPRAKRSLYDSGLRVPLMIRWPKGLGSTVTPGSTSNELVSFVDLAPTVLALAGVTVPAHLPGRVLIGPKVGTAPEFVFAARDRMDTEYQITVGARRAFPLYPQLLARAPVCGSHHVSQSERDNAGVVPAASRTRADRPTGALDAHRAARRRVVRHTKRSVPDNDLSADVAHRVTLERMRKAVNDWMSRSGDQGLVNEPEMIQRMWPGGVQPETARPYILSRREIDVQSRRETMAIQPPMEVVIYVPTQGASIGYTTKAAGVHAGGSTPVRFASMRRRLFAPRQSAMDTRRARRRGWCLRWAGGNVFGAQGSGLRAQAAQSRDMGNKTVRRHR